MGRAGWRNYWIAQMELAVERGRQGRAAQAWGR